MPRRWTVRCRDEMVTLELAWTDGERGAAHAQIASLLGEHAGRAIMIEICKELGTTEGYRTSDEELVARIMGAITRGELRVRRRPIRLPATGGTVAPEPERAPESAPPVEEKTWIGIRLVDNATPPRPVPFRRYKVELPDGSTREGMLDGEGSARLTGIDPGQCRVMFPDLDPDNWSRV